MQPAFERFGSGSRNGWIKSLAIDLAAGKSDETFSCSCRRIHSCYELVKNYWYGQRIYENAVWNWKAFFGRNLKIMAIVAVIVVLALIVEDFINFLQGNDSVIGTLFDRLGIGADNARNAIFEVFGKIKNFHRRAYRRDSRDV